MAEEERLGVALGATPRPGEVGATTEFAGWVAEMLWLRVPETAGMADLNFRMRTGCGPMADHVAGVAHRDGLLI